MQPCVTNWLGNLLILGYKKGILGLLGLDNRLPKPRESQSIRCLRWIEHSAMGLAKVFLILRLENHRFCLVVE